MSILVLYASKHGATRGIAERIAETLERSGRRAESRSVEDSGDVTGYDGFVIGGAVYMGRWLKGVSTFVERNRDLLARRDVWLFSSGPLGTEATDSKGQDLLASSEPKEMAALVEAIHPREHRAFFGALSPDTLTVPERALRRLPAARSIMPEGDFRDWEDIEQWATEIAEQMASGEAARDATEPPEGRHE
jgi:menaquinone-dependent protoporphyrinogen oxidase